MKQQENNIGFSTSIDYSLLYDYFSENFCN